MTQDNAASVETIAGLMRANPNVPITDAVGYLERIGEQYGKKVMVIEGGYQSANGALWDVNADYPGATTVENQSLQARGLDGYLQARHAAQGTWLMGVNLWDPQPRHMPAITQQDANSRVRRSSLTMGRCAYPAPGTLHCWRTTHKERNM